MRLHSYIVTHDSGFSPNPFWGHCTLACCKPVIRRTADGGDWVVGLSRKCEGHRVVYAMRIDEIVDFPTYWRDRRFRSKRPDFKRGPVIHKCGDNIYEPLADGSFRQLQSMHSKGDQEDPKRKAHDLRGERVLIARHFHYFGGEGPSLPPELEELKATRGHKNRFPSEIVQRFLDFIGDYPTGISGPPRRWKDGDQSWMGRCACG